MGLWSLYNTVDGFITTGITTFLSSTAGFNLTSTPPTQGLPTIDSPTPLLSLITLYLTLVTCGFYWVRKYNLKPHYHEPLLLQLTVITHNAFCIGLSIYMCLGISLQAYLLQYKLWGNPYNEKETKMAHFLYVFYMSKLWEFMDTMIMLLKHNIRQVSFLHIYHHVSVSVIWWIVAHHAPGGDAYFSAAVNSGIHVFMYTYYLLSAILRNDEKRRSKYIFWGKYLTQMQMLQFALNLFQAYYCIKAHAPYPQFICKAFFYYMVSLLFLFANFYMQKYNSCGMGQSKLKKGN